MVLITENRICCVLFLYAAEDRPAAQNVGHIHLLSIQMVVPLSPYASFSNAYLVNVVWQIIDCTGHIGNVALPPVYALKLCGHVDKHYL